MWVVLISGVIPEDLSVPVGARVIVGPLVPALFVCRSWLEARDALQFALPSTHDAPPYSDGEAVVFESDRVGCFSLLARYLPTNAISEVAEVRALGLLTRGAGGNEMLRTLEAVASMDSIRQAAANIHMHHNSVSHRVSRAEEALGFDITAPYGRVRLMMTLILHRLHAADSCLPDAQ
ncbi:hypothetical protein QV65_32225 [Rhodococcus erythropolis]|nr:hypothetical protein QV65_32225 [Rhodococcus erythropolis]